MAESTLKSSPKQGKILAITGGEIILISLNRDFEFPFHEGPISKGALGLRKEAAMTEKDTDLKKIKELLEIMKETGLAEIEIKHGDDKISLKRFSPTQPVIGETMAAMPMMRPESGAIPAGTGGTETSNQAATPPAAPATEDLVEIKSPIVGTFYATPSPDSEPYVEVGSAVGTQTIVCIIEAMKVMNEIKAETSGTIADILVTNGQAVEYGQVLFKVRPD